MNIPQMTVLFTALMSYYRPIAYRYRSVWVWTNREKFLTSPTLFIG